MVREGGSIGSANVTWEVEDDPHHDLVEMGGLLHFGDGKTEAGLGVKVRGDTLPELDEMFVVTLTNVSMVSVTLVRYIGGT